MARKGGFIGQDGLNAPDEATDVSASAGDEQVDVSFTTPSDEGGAAVTGYVATSDDGIGATGSSSPITVSGLTNGTAYTFRVWAINPFGYSSPSDASGSVTPAAPKALFLGGGDGGSLDASNTIYAVTISTTGNSSDFGDLTVAVSSNATRGLIIGGQNTNVIEYITIASTGNATDFGDVVESNKYSMGAAASTASDRAYAFGGSTDTNVIQYVVFSTLGDAVDFGDLLSADPSAGCSNVHGGLS